MLRKILIFFSAFMVGMIASDEVFSFNFKTSEQFSKEINGDLSIDTVSENTNDEIPHPPVHFETLEPKKNVEGQIQYTIGARVRSK